MNPFRDAEHAWLWYCSAQRERWNGARPQGSMNERPCDMDDIAAIFSRLCRLKKIANYDAHVLVAYGFMHRPPDRRYEPRELSAWRRGLDQLHTVLAMKGIIYVDGRHT